MRRSSVSGFVLVTLTVPVFSISLIAQGTDPQASKPECGGAIYKSSEVSRPAKITEKPAPVFTDEARANKVSGRIVLSAVLCRSGEVTDVHVRERLPFGMTEEAIEAARRIKFEPASKEGERVSQSLLLEYNFILCCIGDGCKRLVEAVDIVGLSAVSDEQVWKQIKLRPGKVFSHEQMMRDLQALLALGYFDPKATRVRQEAGVNGGVKIIFEVREFGLNDFRR